MIAKKKKTICRSVDDSEVELVLASMLVLRNEGWDAEDQGIDSVCSRRKPKVG